MLLEIAPEIDNCESNFFCLYRLVVLLLTLLPAVRITLVFKGQLQRATFYCPFLMLVCYPGLLSHPLSSPIRKSLP